jgi:hypothetical protein
MTRSWGLFGILASAVVVTTISLPAMTDSPAVAAKPTFKKDVLPIFPEVVSGLSPAGSDGTVLADQLRRCPYISDQEYAEALKVGGARRATGAQHH